MANRRETMERVAMETVILLGSKIIADGDWH